MSTPVDWVALHARLRPHALAAHELASDRRWSYAALDADIARIAGALVERGLVAGDRVASLARNRLALILIHLACARARLIYVPLNWRLSAAELSILVADAEPAVLLGDECLAQAGLTGEALDAFLAKAQVAAPLPAAPLDPDRASLILYTSGTSGTPKGALLSETNITETAINFSVLGNISDRSVVLCDAPMFHIVGLVTNVRPALLQGGTLLVSEGFEADRTLARLSDPDLGATHYFCVPQMAAQLRAVPGFDPAPLRRITFSSGGAPHSATAIRAWLADGIAIADGYGMTEVGTALGMPTDAAMIDLRAGSAGIATPRVATRIVDAAGRVLPPGQEGELQLRGANITAGYWRRPAETAAAFTADGWLRTGDVARADEQGYYWLLDRKKDMFISGGENVYPAEIEGVLAAHPDVAECAVIGVADAKWGEVGHLAVVAAPSSTIDEKALRATLAEAIARYKVPKYVTVLAALPRNGAGKVLKAELRTMLARHAAEVV